MPSKLTAKRDSVRSRSWLWSSRFSIIVSSRTDCIKSLFWSTASSEHPKETDTIPYICNGKNEEVMTGVMRQGKACLWCFKSVI